jgi:hypothetical protein
VTYMYSVCMHMCVCVCVWRGCSCQTLGLFDTSHWRVYPVCCLHQPPALIQVTATHDFLPNHCTLRLYYTNCVTQPAHFDCLNVRIHLKHSITFSFLCTFLLRVFTKLQKLLLALSHLTKLQKLLLALSHLSLYLFACLHETTQILLTRSLWNFEIL